MENNKQEHDHEVVIELEGLAKRLQSRPAAAADTAEIKYRVSRVPPHVRGMDGDAYTPKFVSIGPLHHRPAAHQSNNDLKLAYLHSLISHADPKVDVLAAVQDYTACVRVHEKEARAFYAEPVSLDSKAFADMLVLDGCFILQHLLNYALGINEPRLNSTHWEPSQLRKDLICIENQIPFFILAELLARTPLPGDLEDYRRSRRDFLRSLAVHYLLRMDDEHLKDLPSSKETYHLLHMYSLALTGARKVRPEAHAGWGSHAARVLWKLPIIMLTPVAYLLCAGPEEEDESADKLPNIPSASDLQKVGIKFKKAATRASGFLDVRLEDGDTLVIPAVSIEHFTAPQLQNLIALEQASPELPDDCCSYAFFMDNLVANPNDAALLEAEGILKSNLGSHKAVVTYFNKLCQGNKLELETHYLKEVFEQLMKRSRNPMYAWLRTLRKKYFSSPWGVIAMIVALLVFGSTVLQTYSSFKTH